MSENPYKTPKVLNPENFQSDGSPISSMESKRLRKLYLRSANIRIIAALLFIVGGFSGYLLFLYSSVNNTFELGLLIFLTTFNLIAAIGLSMRTSWGRVIGFIACSLMLLNIPIGTAIGIAGLVALSKAPELFGPRRFEHGPLKKEFKKRKKQKRL